MAEGLLDGVLGGEEEKIEPTEGGTGPIVAAVAANLADQNPEVAAETAAMFRKQTELLEVQKKNAEAEYEFFEAEWGPRLLALRLRTGFQVFIALFATVIGIGLAIVIYDAVHSRSVVIDPFEIAPNIAPQVPSGKIVAAGLLDVLTQIQAANKGSAEHRALSNAWTNEIAIEIPETGVSVGEIERTLRSRFGHDQHIDGDLVQNEKGGIALTVRGHGILPKTFTDSSRDLEKLLTQAGEYVYGQSQPGLWAAYLTENDRNDEAIRFVQGAYVKVDSSERPYLLNSWANAITNTGDEGTWVQALPLWRESVRLKSDYWVGYSNIMAALGGIGDEEGVVRVAEQMMKAAGGRPGRAPENDYGNYDAVVWDLPADRAALIADMESTSGVGTQGFATGAENLSVAQLEVQMHDVEAAALRLKTTPVDERNVPDVAQAEMDRALLAEEGRELMTAGREWDAFAVAYANPIVSSHATASICYAAATYEKTGQPAKADAALKPFGNFTFADCYRFRGDVQDLRGDWAGAQEWYAKAVKLAPSIPSGYYSWGVALAKHGDLDGSAAKFQSANQKGPHWADPLKAWGDVLVRQDKIKDALVKYDEALKYAPNWKQLKEARGAAAKQKS
jgi:tetratricopeptide (TPR) repeat protein